MPSLHSPDLLGFVTAAVAAASSLFSARCVLLPEEEHGRLPLPQPRARPGVLPAVQDGLVSSRRVCLVSGGVEHARPLEWPGGSRRHLGRLRLESPAPPPGLDSPLPWFAAFTPRPSLRRHALPHLCLLQRPKRHRCFTPWRMPSKMQMPQPPARA